MGARLARRRCGCVIGLRYARRRGCAEGEGIVRRIVLFVWLMLLPALACAAPDRADLIHAWEAEMRHAGTFEPQADGNYRFACPALGYDGHVRLLTAIVRDDASRARIAGGVTAMGTVDFELSDLSPEQRDSIGLASWKSERQNFVYDGAKQSWLSIAQWAEAQSQDRGRVWWRLDPVLIGLFVALLLLVVLFSWQHRRARGLLAESSEVHRMARDNLVSARTLREEQAEAMRESLALSRRSAATLEAILAELRRRGD